MKCTRAKPSSDTCDSAGDVDRLSALPDDIVAKILSSVDSSTDAVRTCVLSRRWRPVWKLLPELRLPFFPKPPRRFAAALVNHQVPLRHLQVEGHGQGALLKSVATWLPAAARRVSGRFALLNNADPIMAERGEEEEGEAIELPCFEQATSISICLGFVRIAMPPVPPPADGSGVFSHLTDLCLERVCFHHPSELGNVVSSARCPCLQNLKLRNTPGLQVLAIDSTSLLKMELEEVSDLHDLTVEAPELKELTVEHCFVFSQVPAELAVVAIAAPELVLLDWKDDMESQRHIQDQLSQFPRLRSLGSFLLLVYGFNDASGAYNRHCLEVLLGIQFLENLTLTLGYVEEIEHYQYLMEGMRTLPKVTTLHLTVISIGHSYGASLFHILRGCTGIRKLVLELHADPEEPLTCPPGCNCEHQSNWQSENLLLADLEEIEIQRFGRTTRDLDFAERLFRWATPLTKATIIFDILVREGVVKEVCRMFELFSRPEIHIEFRYHNNKKVLYAPED